VISFTHLRGSVQLTEPLTTFKYMIPIGAPVTLFYIKSDVMSSDFRAKGILELKEGSERYKLKVRVYLPSKGYNVYFLCNESEVKIRYDNPCPFTLWQLNCLSGVEANYAWVTTCGDTSLAPYRINSYWEAFSILS
jgi:hypothetical protein